MSDGNIWMPGYKKGGDQNFIQSKYENTFSMSSMMDATKHHIIDSRPSQLARMMIRAELESMWSTCSRLSVGTVVYDNDFNWGILATAYNGAPTKQEHCNRKPVQDGRCAYCIHSEKNIINSAAKSGISLKDSSMVTMYRPCVSCANDIAQVGFYRIYYRHDYDSDGMKDYVFEVLANANVLINKLPLTPEEVTFSLVLNEWKRVWTSGLQMKQQE